MKKFVLYTLLFFIFSSCKSEKILSDKIINKKWNINYVKSNLGNNPTITKQDKESLITKDYKSKNLVQETEQFLASNDELIDYNKKELSTISKENIIYQRPTKIDSIVNSNNSLLKEKEISKQSKKARNFSFLALLMSISSLFLAWGGLFINEIFAYFGFAFGGISFILGIVSLSKIKSIYRELKKKGEKIKNQERKTKRPLYASMIISIPLCFIIPIVISFAIWLLNIGY
jgi:hypothetical protein